MNFRPFAYALIALALLAGCDRRESDGQSTLPPAEGAASTEPVPTVDATQGETPAMPDPAMPAPEAMPSTMPQPDPTQPAPAPAEPQPVEPQDPAPTDQ